jgi:outer membrane protein OmpA-like peptidoglycan-associated protein
VTSVFRRGGSERELEAALAAGHVVLDDLAFDADGALSSSSRGTVRALAKALGKTTDVWMVEGHVAAGTEADAISEARTKAVKAALVEAGVDPSRVWARGLGASRPPSDPSASAERIELVRMQ